MLLPEGQVVYSIRDATESDLSSVWDLRKRFADWFLPRLREEGVLLEIPASPADLEVLEREWHLLQTSDSECRTMLVIERRQEDHDSPSIVAAAAGAFVQSTVPERTLHSRQARSGFLLQGDILTLDQLREANSGSGANLWLTLWDWDPALGGPESSAVKEVNDLLLVSFISRVKGNNIAALWLLEWPLPAFFRFAEEFGLKPEFIDRQTALALVGARRQENPSPFTASVCGGLFQHEQPRWYYDEKHRLFLRFVYETGVANQGKLAKMLGQSRPMINKLWREVFEGREDHFEFDLSDKDRGWRMLEYLRQHPEEIRPHDSRQPA